MGKRDRKKKTPDSAGPAKAAFSNKPFAGLGKKNARFETRVLSERGPRIDSSEASDDQSADAPDETQLLAQELADVQPLDKEREIVGKRPQARPMLDESDESFLVMRHLDALVNGEIPFDFADTDEYIEAAVADLDRRIVRKLKGGEYAIQDHLDLHGLNRSDAKTHVAEFIKKSRLSKKRCILIIHGRGIGSKDNIPILKNNLRAWLAHGSISRQVLAFTSAQPFDGGTGAVYVLLRG